MITEDYVSFETAKLLKEKGFDEPVRMYFNKYNYPSDNAIQNIKKITGKDMEQIEVHSLFNAEDEPFFNSLQGKDENLFAFPTLQMAMKWLRIEKGIAVIPIISSILDNEKFLWDIEIVVAKTNDTYSQGWIYENQESACEAAIKYCLENLI